MSNFAVFYMIHFRDGGHSEGQVLHVGTEKECINLMNAIPAVSYSGDRPVRDSVMRVVENTMGLTAGEHIVQSARKEVP